jgi:uncharacterized protein YjiS (DUF1127 family)
MEAAMSILNMSATFFGAHSWWSRWNDLKRYVVECRHRIRSRYELEALNERDLADMGMTPLDAHNEYIKPYWRE